ncbi:MAG: hypothetical protein E6H00_13990 [Bacillati bacterium ANGP1]|uniref:Uncharacterized protein n=1 Tax=Candidatus Segetimicrobium genomatis TaxID=2569760 RepID=A0A537JWZ1_9BACT|nr:MAG: hypothetical protein E6H00_13990 [Terrabacteria group bacterium ANGP1]
MVPLPARFSFAARTNYARMKDMQASPPPLWRAAATAAALVVTLGLPSERTAAQPPLPEEVRSRVSAASGTISGTADAVFKLWIEKPVSGRPNCVFSGTLRLDQGRQTLSVGEVTAGTFCGAINQYVVGRLFESSEPVGTFLSRFDLTVLGEKLVDDDRYYLVQGKARDPNNNPRGLIVWIDYDRGLVIDGTLQYTWGRVDVEQRYSLMHGIWVLTEQVLHSTRFDASLKAEYTNFRFASP